MRHTTVDSSIFAQTRGTPEALPLRLAVFGAMPETGNLGVTALHTCLLEGIARRVPAPAITVFDDRPGRTCSTVSLTGGDFSYVRCPVIPTRRLYRRDSLWWARAAGRLGGLGSDAVRALRSAHAVLDATAGDSFTDLYGRRRFARAILEKRLVLEQGCPLVLTPQTIGPFRSASAARRAASILRAAAMVWTRDRRSLDVLGELLDGEIDPARHRCGVDVAFGLRPRRPASLPPRLRTWLEEDPSHPTVGVNVSGLLMNDPETASLRFGFRADYATAMHRLVRRLLSESWAKVLLVPHVMTRPGHAEHDPDACRRIAESIPNSARHRVGVLEVGRDPRHVKWVIRRLDWFCGARMHASIAALSSGVPAAAIAYSPKTLGTFETCGLAEEVADPRSVDTEALVEHLWTSWMRRDETRARLARVLPDVRARAEAQMDEITAFCLGIRRARETRRRLAA